MSAIKSNVEIRYVGRKSPKKDTVAGSGVMWMGHGDVQEVSAQEAVKLLQHPNVWIKASDDFEASEPAPEKEESRPVGFVIPPQNENPEDNNGDAENDISEEDIVNAVIDIKNTGDESAYTESGKVKLDAVRAIVGKELTSKQLNAALKSIEV